MNNTFLHNLDAEGLRILVETQRDELNEVHAKFAELEENHQQLLAHAMEVETARIQLATQLEQYQQAQPVADGELKPCPFCGESGKPVADSYDSHWVICETCGVVTSEFDSDTPEKAVAKWNRRATPQPAVVAVVLPERTSEQRKHWHDMWSSGWCAYDSEVRRLNTEVTTVQELARLRAAKKDAQRFEADIILLEEGQELLRGLLSAQAEKMAPLQKECDKLRELSQVVVAPKKVHRENDAIRHEIRNRIVDAAMALTYAIQASQSRGE